MASSLTSANLQHFRNYTKDLESPAHFIDWNFLYCVSSALGRRVWIGQKPSETFPNLYIIFVAKPGIGKSRPAGFTEDILRNLTQMIKLQNGTLVPKKLIHLAPDTTSFEKMLQSTADAVETYVDDVDPQKAYMHTSICFCLDEEMGTLFRRNTEDVVTFLTKGWDCKDYKSDFVKHGQKELFNTCINFLGCCTPDWLARHIQSGLLSDGFTARTIFLFGDKPRFRKHKMEITREMLESKVAVISHLRKLATLKPGEVIYTSEADKWLENWTETKQDKHFNKDKRLEDYYGRRKHHLIKMAMICHFSDKLTMQIDVEDFENALKIIELAEVDMHRALLSSSTNSLYLLSQKMLEYIRTEGPKEKNQGLNFKQLLMLLWDIGNEEEINRCKDFLLNTGQIGNSTVDGQAYYHIKE